MPELPEVETIVRGLRTKILQKTFVDVWTDAKKLIKTPKSLKEFKKEIKGKKIKRVWRRGKNILFDLSRGKTLLIHQKLTGHLLHGAWNMKARTSKNSVRGKYGTWQPKTKGLLKEKINSYIHLLFILDNGKMLALSDLRKFAKVELLDAKELKKELSFLGCEPLDRDFNFKKFKEIILTARGKIKQVLMNQNIIAGIGNIYSDEILWEAKVSPFKETKELKDKELKKVYKAMRKVLKKAVELRGTSTSDYRDIEGKKGFFQNYRKVYQREGQKCQRCGVKIKRKKLAGRSVHFCPVCQK